jgi:hypothetical protein
MNSGPNKLLDKSKCDLAPGMLFLFPFEQTRQQSIDCIDEVASAVVVKFIYKMSLPKTDVRARSFGVFSP